MEQCSICLEDLWTNVIFLECGHKYHKHCIRAARVRSINCPLCRKKTYRLYKAIAYCEDNMIKYKLKNEGGCCDIM